MPNAINALSFADNVTVHFVAVQENAEFETVREAAIWSTDDDAGTFYISFADYPLADPDEIQFGDEEEHPSLHAAYAALFRSVIRVPLDQ